MDCLNNLVGLKELCTAEAGTQPPYFFLDNAEGIDRNALAQLAKPSNGSGKAFAEEIISSSAMMLLTDIETLIPKGYSIKSSLNSFCNTCSFLGISSTQSFTGVVVKNVSTSKNAYLSLDSLRIVIGATGDYTIILDDGIEPKIITASFTSGVETQIININFKTASKYIKIYFQEAGVPVNALNCPTTSGCGCSGARPDSSTDIQVKGLLNNTETTTQYGFVPCATIVCSLDNIMCTIVNQQPKLFALALFYRSVARYFSEFPVTQRNNTNASFKTDNKSELATMYMELYYERLRGSANVKGIADNMAAALNSVNDVCVVCERAVTTSWAIG